MDGVTTAIVLFVFVCVLFPRLIDNRAQYYAAFALVLFLILFRPIAYAFGFSGTISAVIVAVVQVASILLLFLSAGGLTVRGLTREMTGAFEVIRRGETEAELIIPTGQEGQQRRRKTARESIGEPGERIDLTDDGRQAYPPSKPRPTSQKPDEDEDGPIPMD